jgi:hypothetical protein
VKQSDHSAKCGRIAEALRSLMVLPKGRSIRRFTHGPYVRGESYFVGYTWTRTYANYMTGNVYDVTLQEVGDGVADGVGHFLRPQSTKPTHSPIQQPRANAMMVMRCAPVAIG